MIPHCILQGFPNHVLWNRQYPFKQYKGSERLYNKVHLLNFLSTGASQMVLTLQNPFLSYRHPTEHILVNPLDNIQIPEQSN